jgi:hypothetical protein
LARNRNIWHISILEGFWNLILEKTYKPKKIIKKIKKIEKKKRKKKVKIVFLLANNYFIIYQRK